MRVVDRPDDHGFTLIELLLAVAVMLVIIVPLTSSFVLGIKAANGGLQDTTNSADAQVLAGFFDTDVTSAESVGTSSSCGGAGAILSLAWQDGTRAHVVAYRVVADPAMQAGLALTVPVDRLERSSCIDGSLVTTTVVARSVLRTPAVTVRCDEAACTATNPRRVELTLVEHTPQLADAGAAGRFTVGVTATRKVDS